MITAERLSIAVVERLRDLNETPESLASSSRWASFWVTLFGERNAAERMKADAKLVRLAVDRQLPDVGYPTVRAVERALGFSEFTLFALSADGRGLPEFGEKYAP